MAAIVFNSVSKHFRQGGFFFSRRKPKLTYALQSLSLSVARGEVLSLLGPNGSGKSTTLKLIATVLLPDQGTVLVNGSDTRTDEPGVRRQVGLALSSERSFFPRLTARENLGFFAALENIAGPECQDRVDSVLERVGLIEEADKQVMKLSSGLYQRLGIARALIKNPPVLLLDEPTRSLDPGAASRIWTLIGWLADSGITMVVATHNFQEAISISNRVAVVERGRLLGIQSVAHCHAQQLQSYYLELTGKPEPVSCGEGIPA